MFRVGKIIVLLIILNACVFDDQLIKVNPDYVFHNNNSKVWMVIHKYRNGKDFSPLSMKYKDLLIFHRSGNFYMQKMHTLGDDIGQKGIFSISGDVKKVKFEFQNKTWYFTFTMLTNERIILKPINNYNYTLELIPIPEPKT